MTNNDNRKLVVMLSLHALLRACEVGELILFRVGESFYGRSFECRRQSLDQTNRKPNVYQR